MNTPVLTVASLANLICQTAETAFDEDLRASDESDASIIGKLNLLDGICVAFSLHGQQPTAAEDAILAHAREKIDEACDYLAARIAA